LVKIQSFTLKT